MPGWSMFSKPMNYIRGLAKGPIGEALASGANRSASYLAAGFPRSTVAMGPRASGFRGLFGTGGPFAAGTRGRAGLYAAGALGAGAAARSAYDRRSRFGLGM